MPGLQASLKVFRSVLLAKRDQRFPDFWVSAVATGYVPDRLIRHIKSKCKILNFFACPDKSNVKGLFYVRHIHYYVYGLRSNKI